MGDILASVNEDLQYVEVETGRPVRSAVIWLHGLGADGHDFEPIVPALGLKDRGVRFVFPHAPLRAVTVNLGLIMRAWFDITDLEFRGPADEKGIRDSVAQVARLVDRERGRGVASRRIVLAGFSQGGTVALHVALRYPEPLAGVAALSTLLAGGTTLESELSPANRRVPIIQAHGTADPLIPVALGERTRDRLLELEYPIVWKSYPMQHEVCAEEVADLGAWLRERLSD